MTEKVISYKPSIAQEKDTEFLQVPISVRKVQADVLTLSEAVSFTQGLSKKK